MSPKDIIHITQSARQFKRTVVKGISGSYTKALTELILNSVPSYERLLGKIESTNNKNEYRIVSLPTPQDDGFDLDIKIGDILTLEEVMSLKSKFEKSRFLLHIDGGTLGNVHPEFKVDVLINRSRTDAGLAVKDYAEGLDREDLKNLFSSYGSEKESHSSASRSLFGRGALDVLAVPQQGSKKKPGKIESIKNKVKTTALFSWPDNEDQPQIEISSQEKALGKNQTIVTFHPSSTPLKDTVIEKLSKFYLLRNVIEDSHIKLRVAETDKNWNPRKYHDIEFENPEGTEIVEIETSFKFGNKEIGVEGAIFSSPDALSQQGKERRTGGLLIQDVNGTILDLTLFKFDREPHAAKLFGSVVLDGAYDLIREKLNQTVPEEILLETRDGLNPSHSFHKKLSEVMEKIIEPCVEEEKRKQRRSSNFSDDANKRIQKGMEVLNELAKSLDTQSGPVSGPLPGDKEEPPEVFDDGIAFDPNELVVQEDTSAWVSIIVNKDFFTTGDTIVIESDSKHIIPSKSKMIIPEFEGDTHRIEGLKIKGIEPGQGIVSAIINGTKAYLNVLITEEEVITPHNGIEFKPYRPGGRPLAWNTAKLYVNVDVIQPSVLTITAEKNDIELRDFEYYVDEHSDLIAYPSKKGQIAVLPFKYKGKKEGAKSRVFVDAINRDGGAVQAECFVKTRTVQPINAGIFKGITFEASDDNTWDVYLEKKSGDVVINTSFPTSKFMLGNTAAEANANYEKRADCQAYVTEKLMNFCVWHLLQKSIEDGTTPNLDASQMYVEVNRKIREICLRMYEGMVDTSNNPKTVYVSKAAMSDNEDEPDNSESEVFYNNIDVPEDQKIPDELAWIPADKVVMRNIIQMEYDRTQKYWRIIIKDKNTEETKDIQQYNDFQIKLLWRYIVEEVVDLENVDGYNVTVAFKEVWKDGDVISHLDSRIWGDKDSLPDKEKRWILQSLFYLCTALYVGEHTGKQNRAEFNFKKMVMEESKMEWSD